MQTLVGRDGESRLLDAFVAETVSGGAGLFLRGPAGIGKSSLLASMCERARDEGCRVLTTAGVQSESRMAFAAVHRLVRPILHHHDRLPPRQRRALLSAFGMNDVTAPDPFLIALAALELLALAAAERPVLAVVDDIQWLDVPSAEVLAFVVRRVGEDPIAVVAAAREGYETTFDGVGLVGLDVEPLTDSASAALLEQRAPDLDSRLRSRVLALARGNPLALIELASAPSSRRRVPERDDAEPLMTARLERAFTSRFQELPEATRTLLLVSSASERTVVAEVVDAGRRLSPGHGAQPDPLTPAVAAGLIDLVDQRIEFRHPLVRSAIYGSATMAERQRVHSALAETLADDPDRRAWHRAEATSRPDEAVALELEAAADRAEDRGARWITLQALERSAALTPDPARRSERLLRAAEIAFELGDRLATVRLHERVDPGRLTPRASGRHRLLSEAIEPAAADPVARVGGLLAVAEHMHELGDSDLALRFAHLAAAQTYATDLGPASRLRVLSAAERMVEDRTSPLLLSIYSQTDPHGHTAELMERTATFSPRGIDPDTAYLVGAALNLAGAFSLSPAFLASAAGGLRAEGRLRKLVEVLAQQAWTAFTSMEWAVAVPSADEALALARETRQPFWEVSALMVQGLLTGVRGDVEQAHRLIGAAEAIALPLNATPMLCGIQLARGMSDLSVGRYEQAFAQLRRVFDPSDPAYHHFQCGFALGDLAEAAVHTDNAEVAREQLDHLGSEVGGGVFTWPQVGVLYARPLLAGDSEAEQLFHAALSTDLSRWPLYRARILLAYGRWLRRRRRPSDARAPLRSAREAFDALGAGGFGDQARNELRAAGERSQAPVPQTWRTLSPQELHIARLAAEGLSNKEIAERLYLSHRTVGSHLYRIYPKLNITSRSQLPGVLGASA